MKVKVNNHTYLMHWETRKFKPKDGKNMGTELEATDCIIRMVKPSGDTVEVARGHVSQSSCDQANGVTARRLAFLKAIKHMSRALRKAFGDEYNKTCRVVSNSSGRTNRKLRNRIFVLEKALSLANSMILSGEQHSEVSRNMIKAAMS